tara:strand:+ start:47 stop:514 length:468 start_codon:yes stop_codon:yes gene_type:complete
MKRAIELDKLMPEFPDLAIEESYIYKLFDGDTCAYVGKTNCLRSRIYQHIGSDKTFTRVEADICKSADASYKEAATIIEMKPTLNMQLPVTLDFPNLTTVKKQIIEELSRLDEALEVIFITGNEGCKKTKYVHKKDADELISRVIKAIHNKKECK